MQAKENQWRFMNVIALHEMNMLEHHACAELNALSAHLDLVEVHASQKTALVAACRAYRAQQIFHAVVKPVLSGLTDPLVQQQHEYQRACNTLFQIARDIRLHEAACLVSGGMLSEELKNFRRAVVQHERVAMRTQLTEICDALETLAGFISLEEMNAMICTAKSLRDAAEAKEREKSMKKVARARNAKGKPFHDI